MLLSAFFELERRAKKRRPVIRLRGPSVRKKHLENKRISSTVRFNRIARRFQEFV
jgi:hypothetical protein